MGVFSKQLYFFVNVLLGSSMGIKEVRKKTWKRVKRPKRRKGRNENVEPIQHIRWIRRKVFQGKGEEQ